MRRYLFDSNAVTAFLDRKSPFADRVRDAGRRGIRLGTCEPVVAELYYGLEFSASREANSVRLRRGLSHLRSWPFDRAAAVTYGRVAAELSRRGRKMQVVDMMLAAIALSLGATVVETTDTDLLAVSGLSVENWQAPADGVK